MDYKMYLMRALTNMHVGSGDDTFGVVDKLVQRDPVTYYPAIYSSSLKGALREHCKNIKNKDLCLDYVFGKPSNGNQKTEQGRYRFFTAHILALPARSNAAPFFRVTTPSILENLLETLKTFKIPKSLVTEIDDLKKISEQTPSPGKALIHGNMSEKIEDWDMERNPAIPETSLILGSNIALVSKEDFTEFIERLPVIARNHLENGKSTNLWYEEIVPRESLFYFMVGFGEKYQNDFETAITDSNVQIGANASIGYGFTQISKIGG